jgi:thiol-disulfide isomerase/thioredoxin
MNRPGLLVGLLLFASWEGSAAQAMGVGDTAPDFAGTDLQGRPFSLSGQRGKVVLLNFWATWCAPCREEMPAFSKWQRSYGARGLAIVGVSMDDELESVKQALAQRPVSYPVVMGDAKLGERMGGVLGLPLSYLLDADGRVVARYQGEASLPAIEAKIRELLATRRR